MNARTPPPPSGDLKLWSRQLYNYLVGEAQIKQRVEPTPILLSHKSAVVPERAAVEGLLLYDPVSKKVIYSRNGEFFPFGDNVIVAATAPANPQQGQLWYNTSSPQGLFVRVNNQWEPAYVPPVTNGTQTINTAGLSQVVFDQIPREAQSVVITFANTTLASGNLIMDFVGSTASNTSFARQINAGVFGPVESAGIVSEVILDTIGAGGFIGNIYLERQPANNAVWVFTGSYRRGSPNIVNLAGRIILDVVDLRLRFRPSTGLFSTNPIIVKWRV
jgi:hypothetical protein